MDAIEIQPEDWPDAYMELKAALEKSCKEIEAEQWSKIPRTNRQPQKRFRFP